MDEQTIDFNVVSPILGHQINKGVNIVQAARDIFKRVRTQGMQCAVKGDFIQFDTVEELQSKLEIVAKDGFNICVFDELIGG